MFSRDRHNKSGTAGGLSSGGKGTRNRTPSPQTKGNSSPRQSSMDGGRLTPNSSSRRASNTSVDDGVHHRSASATSRGNGAQPGVGPVSANRPPRSPAPSSFDLHHRSASSAAASQQNQQPHHVATPTSEAFELEPIVHSKTSTSPHHRTGGRGHDSPSLPSPSPSTISCSMVIGQLGNGAPPRRLVDRTFKGRGGDLTRCTSLSNMPRDLVPKRNHISPFGRNKSNYNDDCSRGHSEACTQRSESVSIGIDCHLGTDDAENNAKQHPQQRRHGRRRRSTRDDQDGGSSLSMCSSIRSSSASNSDDEEKYSKNGRLPGPPGDPLSGTHTARGPNPTNFLTHDNQPPKQEVDPEVAEAVSNLIGNMLQGVENARKVGLSTFNMYDVRTRQCVMCERLMLTYHSNSTTTTGKGASSHTARPVWSIPQFQEAVAALDTFDRRANRASLSKVASQLQSGTCSSIISPKSGIDHPTTFPFPSATPYTVLEGVVVVDSVDGSPVSDNAAAERSRAFSSARNANPTATPTLLNNNGKGIPAPIADGDHEYFISSAPTLYSFAETYALFPYYYSGDIRIPSTTVTKTSRGAPVKKEDDTESFVCCWECAMRCATRFTEEGPSSGGERHVQHIRITCEDTELGTSSTRTIAVDHQSTPLVLLSTSASLRRKKHHHNHDSSSNSSSDASDYDDGMLTALISNPITAGAMAPSPGAASPQEDNPYSPDADGWRGITLSPLTPQQHQSPPSGSTWANAGGKTQVVSSSSILHRYSPWTSLAPFQGALFPGMGAIGGINQPLCGVGSTATPSTDNNNCTRNVGGSYSPPRGSNTNVVGSPHREHVSIHPSGSPLEQLSPTHQHRRFRLRGVTSNNTRNAAVVPRPRSHTPFSAVGSESLVETVAKPFLLHYEEYKRLRAGRWKKQVSSHRRNGGGSATPNPVSSTTTPRKGDSTLDNIRLQLSGIKQSGGGSQSRSVVSPSLHKQQTPRTSTKAAPPPAPAASKWGFKLRPIFTFDGEPNANRNTSRPSTALSTITNVNAPIRKDTPRRKLFESTPKTTVRGGAGEEEASSATLSSSVEPPSTESVWSPKRARHEDPTTTAFTTKHASLDRKDADGGAQDVSKVPPAEVESLANSAEDLDELEAVDGGESPAEVPHVVETSPTVDKDGADHNEDVVGPPSDHLVYIVGSPDRDVGEGGHWVSITYPDSYERSRFSSRSRSPHSVDRPNRDRSKTQSPQHNSDGSPGNKYVAYRVLPTPSPRRSVENHDNDSADDLEHYSPIVTRPQDGVVEHAYPDTAAPSPMRHEEQAHAYPADEPAVLPPITDEQQESSPSPDRRGEVIAQLFAEEDPPITVCAPEATHEEDPVAPEVVSPQEDVKEESSPAYSRTGSNSPPSHSSTPVSRSESGAHSEINDDDEDDTDREPLSDTHPNLPLATSAPPSESSDHGGEGPSNHDVEDGDDRHIDPIPIEERLVGDIQPDDQPQAEEGYAHVVGDADEHVHQAPLNVDWEVAAHVIMGDANTRSVAADGQHYLQHQLHNQPDTQDALEAYVAAQQGLTVSPTSIAFGMSPTSERSPTTTYNNNNNNLNEDSFLRDDEDDDTDYDGSYMMPPTTTDADHYEHHHPTGIHIPVLSWNLNNHEDIGGCVDSAPPTGTPRTPRLASSRGGGIPSVVPVGIREVAFVDNIASALVAAALLHPEDVTKMVELSRTNADEDHDIPQPSANTTGDDITSPAAAGKIAEIEERLVDDTLLGLQGWWRGRVLWTPLSCRHNGIARRGVTLADGTVVVGGTVAPTCKTTTVSYTDEPNGVNEEWMMQSFRHTPLPSISSSTPSSNYTSDEDDDEDIDDKILETGRRRRIAAGGGPLDNASSNDSVTSLEEALGGTTKALLAMTNNKLLKLQADSHMEPVMLFDTHGRGEDGVGGTSQDLVFFSEMPQGLIDIEERSKRRNRHGSVLKSGFTTSVSPPPNRRSISGVVETTSSSSSGSDSDDVIAGDASPSTHTKRGGAGHTTISASSPSPQQHRPSKEDFLKEYAEWMQSPSRSGTRPEIPADMLSELEIFRLQQQLRGGGIGDVLTTTPTTPLKLSLGAFGSPTNPKGGGCDDEDVVLAGTDLPARFVSEAQLPPTPRSGGDASSSSTHTTPRMMMGSSPGTSPRHNGSRRLSSSHFIPGDSAISPSGTFAAMMSPRQAMGLVATLSSPATSNAPSSFAPYAATTPNTGASPPSASKSHTSSSSGLTRRQLRNQREKGVDESGEPLSFGSPRINNGEVIRPKYFHASM